MNLAKVFKKYTVVILLITLTAIIILLAMVPFVLPAGSLSFLPTFEPVTKNTSAAGTIQCASWSSVNLNGCTWEMFKTNPKNPKCITASRVVNLNLKATGATSVRWKEVPAATYCTDPTVVKAVALAPSSAYATSKKITIPSTNAGDKKICVQFYGNGGSKSPICGGIINYNPTTSTNPISEYLPSSNIRACSRVAKSGKEINLATYNLGGVWGPTTAQNVAVSEFVKYYGIDVLIMQEIMVTPTANDVAEIRANLKKHYNRDWYYHFQPHKEETPINSYGNMIISKYQILENEKRLYDAKSGGDRYFMRYKIKTPYGNMQVFNIHTRAGTEACAGTQQAAQFIKDRVGTSTEYAVVGGDFNLGWDAIEGKNEGGCNLPSTTRIFTRSCISGASSCGYDKIDHIFRPKTSAYSFAELCRKNNYIYNGVGASMDHHPVLSTLKFN